jgi:hypothetical protein
VNRKKNAKGHEPMGKQPGKPRETVLTRYTSHGRNDEQSNWWARDYDGREFKFVISGSSGS